MSESSNKDIAVTLSAVIVSANEECPQVLMLPPKEVGQGMSLPFGQFSPHNHRTLEQGLKDWVRSSTGLELDYVEQVYTFGNLYRSHDFEDKGQRLLTISYLALTTPAEIGPEYQASWQSYYQFFPWEDHRSQTPPVLSKLMSKLSQWSQQGSDQNTKSERTKKIEFAFGDTKWDPDKALFRYELLYEAGLVKEAVRDWNDWPANERDKLPIDSSKIEDSIDPGLMMSFDHRRILASAIGRLRGKLRYRPLIFELLPPKFTLLHIQKVMESLHGVTLHKQNFRRLLLSDGLVQECGEVDRNSMGRPASLYQFAKHF